MTARYELFEHGADIGVRGLGPTRAAAFEQTALALTAVVADPAEVQPLEVVSVQVTAPDDELLLVDFLNALVFEMATRRMLFSRFEVHVDGRTLTARAWGEPVAVARHHPAVEVKGATVTELEVAEADGEWRAQCVVDV